MRIEKCPRLLSLRGQSERAGGPGGGPPAETQVGVQRRRGKITIKRRILSSPPDLTPGAAVESRPRRTVQTWTRGAISVPLLRSHHLHTQLTRRTNPSFVEKLHQRPSNCWKTNTRCISVYSVVIVHVAGSGGAEGVRQLGQDVRRCDGRTSRRERFGGWGVGGGCEDGWSGSSHLQGGSR